MTPREINALIEQAKLEASQASQAVLEASKVFVPLDEMDELFLNAADKKAVLAMLLGAFRSNKMCSWCGEQERVFCDSWCESCRQTKQVEYNERYQAKRLAERLGAS